MHKLGEKKSRLVWVRYSYCASGLKIVFLFLFSLLTNDVQCTNSGQYLFLFSLLSNDVQCTNSSQYLTCRQFSCCYWCTSTACVTDGNAQKIWVRGQFGAVDFPASAGGGTAQAEVSLHTGTQLSVSSAFPGHRACSYQWSSALASCLGVDNLNWQMSWQGWEFSLWVGDNLGWQVLTRLRVLSLGGR